MYRIFSAYGVYDVVNLTEQDIDNINALKATALVQFTTVNGAKKWLKRGSIRMIDELPSLK